DREYRKFEERLAVAVGRRTGNTIADRVDQDDEITARINDLAGTDERQEIFCFATQPGGPNNGVGFGGVQLAECAVAEAKLLNYGATPQLEVSKLDELLRPVGTCLSTGSMAENG